MKERSQSRADGEVAIVEGGRGGGVGGSLDQCLDEAGSLTRAEMRRRLHRHQRQSDTSNR